ncbi:YcnI family copper-binding membrane protein [Kitasatospora sp. NBC_01266]|uniref:YcnI family copper-binding membrane protein n=1 Tax=Kitasatospora sp. NBC_01266 TaxID=2903572 RepID=UPI002E321577|nr:YcnI family protein [Kitasatospora sp. NBC_01266]
MRSLPARRSVTAVVLAAGAVLATAVPAFAHVTVQPNTAQQGGYTAVAFRVPDESATASTVKLEVTVPTDHPIASVSTQPVPGWSATVDKTPLTTPVKTDDGDSVTAAVSKITWTADATGKVGPGQFQEFKISFGPLPKDTDKLVFKALQTYDDGTVVRWIDEAKPGQPEPQHPAPTLTLTPAANAAPAAALNVAPTTTAAAKSDDGTARTLGVVGIVVGVVGAGLGAAGLRRRSGTPSA